VQIWLVTAATALVHLLLAGRYDFFRNELYFLACGMHPDFSYSDTPPLIPLLLRATQLFGSNVWLMRLPAAIAAVLLVPLTAKFARLLGARGLAVVVAASAAAIAPALAGITTVLTTQTFEPLAWTACAYFVARAVLLNESRALLWAGLVVGVEMNAKYGVAMWVIPLGVGVLLTPARRILATRDCWLGALIALSLTASSLIWQALNGWPFVVGLVNHSAQNLPGTPWHFELTQAMEINPVLALLCIAGAIAPFLRQDLKPARFLTISFIAATVLDIAAIGKDYYLIPVYPTMFALGAAAAAHFKPWIMRAGLAAAVVVSLIQAPVALPLLPPATLAHYMDATHQRPPPDETGGIGAPLTQLLSDELGWHELEQRVAAIYQSLPEEERRKATILAADYGEAAAVDFFGRADGLPPAISAEDQYYFWGTRGSDGSVIIHINGDPHRWERLCRSVTVAGTFGVPYAMPYENGRPIFICRGLRLPLQTLWPRMKRIL
jgi:hypothetical protein